MTCPKSPQTLSVTDVARQMGQAGDLKRKDFGTLRGVEGIRMHQQMQKDRGESFRAEVAIQTSFQGYVLQGRIDGVEETDSGIRLEEYKTTRDPKGDAADPDPRHVLQLFLYGWMWEQNHGVPPELRLTYLSPNGETAEAEVSKGGAVEELLKGYVLILKEQQAWVAKRNRALQNLRFPYHTLRAGQEALMASVEEAFAQNGRLIAEAPTGIGKTLAVLVPALKAMGDGQIETLFVATCRNAGKNTIEDAFRQVVEQLPGLRALTLQARERICNRTGTPCQCDTCPLAKGFYDRLPEGLAALKQEQLWDTNTWKRVAEEHDLCPFAFCMAAAREADVIVGDINYALDPSARLEFLFGKEPQGVGLIIDEAHHLPDRTRGMLSACLHPKKIRHALREIPAAHRALLQPDLNRVIRKITEYCKANVETNGWPKEDAEKPTAVSSACTRALETLELSLAESPPQPNDPRPGLFQELMAFRSAAQLDAAAHVPYTEEGALHWFCRDPAEWIRNSLDALGASVLFSATLTPLRSFKRLTGLGPETREVVLDSPFDPRHLSVQIDDSISLAYKDRTPETFFRLSEGITSLLSEHRKNTIVFFPSYSLMNEVASRMPPADLVMGPVRMQPRGLQEEEAREFLQPFFESDQAGAVFAVLGGALNEGIDLPGSALTRVIVVSIGLSALCMERELLREGFVRSGEDGFFMAYALPGLIRIRQAMGRVIRGPEDVGEIILIDQRFSRSQYEMLLEK